MITPQNSTSLISVLVVDAIDACLEQDIRQFGTIIPGNHGKQVVVLPKECVYPHTIDLPDGTGIDIIRNRGLVYLHDWHLDIAPL